MIKNNLRLIKWKIMSYLPEQLVKNLGSDQNKNVSTSTDRIEEK